MKKLKEFLEKHRNKITVVIKISKMIVFFTLLYTAFTMYQLGNIVVSGVISAVAISYVVLNKLDSVI